MVVGGGDTAMEEAMYLSGLCSSVTLVHRRDEFRALEVDAGRAWSKNPKIKILYSHASTRCSTSQGRRSTGVRVKNTEDAATSAPSTAPAMFVAIGHTPMTELFNGQLDMHDNGYLKTKPGTTRTNIPGVFAAGDVQDFDLPPGRHRRGHGLHGGARRGAVPRRAGVRYCHGAARAVEM